jgi:hypothetical protein
VIGVAQLLHLQGPAGKRDPPDSDQLLYLAGIMVEPSAAGVPQLTGAASLIVSVMRIVWCSIAAQRVGVGVVAGSYLLLGR